MGQEGVGAAFCFTSEGNLILAFASLGQPKSLSLTRMCQRAQLFLNLLPALSEPGIFPACLSQGSRDHVTRRAETSCHITSCRGLKAALNCI